MLITCPNCEAGYDVPDHLLAGDGRRLRCKACTEEWHAKLPPESDGPKPEAPAPDASQPPVQVAQADADAALPMADSATAPRRRRLPWLAAATAWAASLVILLSAGAATLRWRTDIAVAWPASERVLRTQPRFAVALQHG